MTEIILYDLHLVGIAYLLGYIVAGLSNQLDLYLEDGMILEGIRKRAAAHFASKIEGSNYFKYVDEIENGEWQLQEDLGDETFLQVRQRMYQEAYELVAADSKWMKLFICPPCFSTWLSIPLVISGLCFFEVSFGWQWLFAWVLAWVVSFKYLE